MASATTAKKGRNGTASSWTDDPQRAEKNAAHLEALENAAPTATVSKIELPRLDIRQMCVKVIGDSPLIVHRWSEKSKRQMLNKQLGKASTGREVRNPQEEYEQTLYPFPGGGFGFPSIGFKCAAVSACTSLGKTVTKVQARQAFHLIGELVKIDGTPRPREDMVRVGMGVADLRYRAEFPEWAATLQIRYNARVLSNEQVINLFNTAGFAVGVGEWRSEKDGSYGLFHVAREGE